MPRLAPVRHVDPSEATVVDGVNLFLDRTYRRAAAGQVTWGHYHAMVHRLRRVAEVLGRDTLLQEVGKHELEQAVLHFAARPPARPRPYQKTPKDRPLAVVTAREMIASMRALFVWVSEHDLLGWEKPRGFDSLFRLKRRQMQTAEDREREARCVVSGEVETFTVADLDRLFRAGRSRDRLLLLLGLNLGFTNIDVSCLRTFEVMLDAERPYVHKRRNKTGVEAKWLLWPETAELLRRHRVPENPEKLWLLTDYGNRLVETNIDGRRDAVDQAWKMLIARIGDGHRYLSFRFLRKTGADAIKRLGGLEESEMYLAHQEPGLNKSYANRNWDRMWACLERFRATLAFLGPAWTIDPAECLFTQASVPDPEAVTPPHVPGATKRNRLGLRNVSFHPTKRKYYVQVFRGGRTHWDGYFDTPEEAAAAAARIRLGLEQQATGARSRYVGGRRPRTGGGRWRGASGTVSSAGALRIAPKA